MRSARGGSGISVEQIRALEAVVRRLAKLDRMPLIKPGDTLRLPMSYLPAIHRNWGNPEITTRKPAGCTAAGSV